MPLHSAQIHSYDVHMATVGNGDATLQLLIKYEYLIKMYYLSMKNESTLTEALRMAWNVKSFTHLKMTAALSENITRGPWGLTLS